MFRVGRLSIRQYRILALESSCDDSCVALLEKKPGSVPKPIDEVKATLQSAKTGGIIPTVAHEFHQQHIAELVKKFCSKHGISAQNPPDLLCVTRGPGMVGSLSASLQFAKGLAVAWDRPLVGVHHMLGHLLTAKLPATESPSQAEQLRYPFLSLLCSGGHTMLVFSKSLVQHEVIINTADIAAGDSLDKCARELGLQGNMLGPQLEKYVNEIGAEKRLEFSKIKADGSAQAFGLHLKMPMRAPKHKKVPDTIEFSFASFLSSITAAKKSGFSEEARQFVAFKLQETLFDHIINRINVALAKHGPQGDGKFAGVQDFVCSGGVAANGVLRQKLFGELDGEKFRFHFPDLRLCTDNATMIGNAGVEIFEHLRLKSTLDILPVRKWPMDGLLAIDGWEPVSEAEFQRITGTRSEGH